MLKDKILLIFITTIVIFLFPIHIFAIDNTNITVNNNSISISGNGSYTPDKGRQKDVEKMDSILEKYKEAITFVGGLATITMIVIFMKHCIKLGVLGTEHWALKRNSIMALLWYGLAAALLGGMTLVFAISYNLFG